MQMNLGFFLSLRHPLVLFLHFLVMALFLLGLYWKQADRAFNAWYSDFLTLKTYKENPPPKESPIVIVDIDDASFDGLSKSYGSMRIAIANLILKLKKANPKCLAVHFLFYGKGLSIEDIYLTAASDAHFPIFFLAQLTKDGDYLTPIEAFSAVSPKYGFLNFHTDPDKIVRRMQLFAKIGETLEWDLSSQIFTTRFQKDPKRPATLHFDPALQEVSIHDAEKIPWRQTLDHNATLRLRYTQTLKDIPVISALDLLQEKTDLSLLQNKIVLLDGTASVYQNKIATPLGTMSSSLVLANALETMNHAPVAVSLSDRKTILGLILFLIFLFGMIAIRRSVLQTVLGLTLGIFVAFYAFESLNKQNIVLPYGVLLLSILFPGFYIGVIRYFELFNQSRSLIRRVSLDSLTGLYAFKYFTFVLQRHFIRQKKKKSGLYVIALELFHAENNTPISALDLNLHFLKNLGDFLRHRKLRNALVCFSSLNARCFIAFPEGKNSALLETVHTLIKDLNTLIHQDTLPLKLRCAAVDMDSAHVSSSFALVQILQFLLSQKNKNEAIQEYQSTELTERFSEDTPFPEDELAYVSMRIDEDTKELELVQKRLSRSMQEFVMTQKLSAMGQLSSYYAHELKNPLHNLLNCFETLEDPNESKEAKDEIKLIMKSELKRVIQLTQKMGAYFKPSDEQPAEVHLNALIEDSVAFLDRKFKESSVEIFLELDPNIPLLFLVGDQFKQMFLNLFLNALEAMPTGGKLSIATFYTPPAVRITVSDTGQGIHPLDLERIFEAFYTTKKGKGSGLGLFACYNILKTHGGTITVESTPDKGSCFKITLPV
jgi:signal transduction histidine kinase/CHASE2 domain-containing sensor protein